MNEEGKNTPEHLSDGAENSREAGIDFHSILKTVREMGDKQIEMMKQMDTLMQGFNEQMQKQIVLSQSIVKILELGLVGNNYNLEEKQTSCQKETRHMDIHCPNKGVGQSNSKVASNDTNSTSDTKPRRGTRGGRNRVYYKELFLKSNTKDSLQNKRYIWNAVKAYTADGASNKKEMKKE